MSLSVRPDPIALPAEIDRAMAGDAAPHAMLRALAACFRAQRAQLQLRSPTGALEGVHIHDTALAHPPLEEQYRREGAASDPAWAALARQPAGTVLRCIDTWDDAFVAGSEFHQAVLAPAGLRWLLAGQFAPAADRRGMITLLRSPDQAAFSADDLLRLGELLPRFAEGEHAAEHLEQAFGAAAGLMQRLQHPCLVTDRRGRCLQENAAFRECVRDERLLVHLGRVRFETGAAQQLWQDALEETHVTGAEQAVELPMRGGSAWTVSLRPWYSRPSGRRPDQEQRLILALFQPAPELMAPIDDASWVPRLTTAELDVLSSMLRGNSAQVIADARRSSVHTVRSQIGRILVKAGFRTRRELIATHANSGFLHSLSSARTRGH